MRPASFPLHTEGHSGGSRMFRRAIARCPSVPPAQSLLYTKKKPVGSCFSNRLSNRLEIHGITAQWRCQVFFSFFSHVRGTRTDVCSSPGGNSGFLSSVGEYPQGRSQAGGTSNRHQYHMAGALLFEGRYTFSDDDDAAGEGHQDWSEGGIPRPIYHRPARRGVDVDELHEVYNKDSAS